MPDASWTCRCGAFEMTVRDVPGSGVAAVCYCVDCRAFAHLHGAGDALDAAGGVALYSTTPDTMDVRHGADHLRCDRLSARGPLRWSVACCDTPLGNSAPRKGVPFFSVLTENMGEGAPEPVVRLHRGSALGRVPRPHGSLYALVFGVARRLLGARLSGRWRDTPFFDDAGNPVAKPGRPDAEALRAAYGRAR